MEHSFLWNFLIPKSIYKCLTKGVWLYIHTCIHTHAYAYIHMHIYMYMHIHNYVYTHAYIWALSERKKLLKKTKKLKTGDLVYEEWNPFPL